ncbi:MAG: hypothetical protein ACE5HB_05230, partial [Terriglobia bacterium]
MWRPLRWACVGALFLLGVEPGALAQEAPPAAAGAHDHDLTTSLSAESEQKLHTAFDHLYSLEFPPSLVLF